MKIKEHDFVSVHGRGGTIVHVYHGGKDFEVEFDYNRVETVNIKDIVEILNKGGE